jgi:hypothetical protein
LADFPPYLSVGLYVIGRDGGGEARLLLEPFRGGSWDGFAW